MEKCYMLDTNIASYIIKGNIPRVRQRLLTISTEHVCISSITQAELLFGVAKSTNPHKLKIAVHEFLLHLDILCWDSEAANCYAQVRAKLEAKGKICGNMDMLIAAHALTTQSILVTNDKGFKQIEGLKLEDWTL